MSNSIAPGTQMNGSKSDNFESYLIFDYQEFQGMISQPEPMNQLNNDQQLYEERKQQNLEQQSISQLGGTLPMRLENAKKPIEQSFFFQEKEDDDDEKQIPPLHIQGMEILEKTKDKNNYDEFYTFLMGLDFLNISNTRNRVDPILMDQFKSLMKIKEYFVLLKNHIDRITEYDTDLWFDELKNTFKLMLHQFENMINSISEQINPVSLSVCFFRCIEYIKIFDRFVHMRTFHQQNIKGEETPIQKLHRSVQLCLLWKRVTGNANFDKFIHHMDSEPFNCGTCEKCKRDNAKSLILQYQQNMSSPVSNFQLLKQQQQNSLSDNQTGLQSIFRGNTYYNTKIFQDIQEGFAKMIDKDINYLKKYQKKNDNSDSKSNTKQFVLMDRGNSFRQIISPISKQSQTNEFYLS